MERYQPTLQQPFVLSWTRSCVNIHADGVTLSICDCSQNTRSSPCPSEILVVHMPEKGAPCPTPRRLLVLPVMKFFGCLGAHAVHRPRSSKLKTLISRSNPSRDKSQVCGVQPEAVHVLVAERESQGHCDRSAWEGFCDVFRRCASALLTLLRLHRRISLSTIAMRGSFSTETLGSIGRGRSGQGFCDG